MANSDLIVSPRDSSSLLQRLRALDADMSSLLARRSPSSSSPVPAASLSSSLAPRVLAAEQLRASSELMRASIASERAALAAKRERVHEAQQQLEATMERGLDSLKQLELDLAQQRDVNARLQHSLDEAIVQLNALAEQHAKDEAALAEKQQREQQAQASPPVAAVKAAVSTSSPSPPLVKRDYRAETASEIRSSLAESWLLQYSDLFFEAKLGVGVSSTVYAGTYKKTQPVAIKVLKLEQAAKDLKDFRKELVILSQVRAPQIVAFLGATLEPKLCVVMELCPRGTLFHALARTPAPAGLSLTWGRALQWCVQMAQGLEVLHTWTPQIVHRDLKPLNLLLDAQWDVKICDFGLSRFTHAGQGEQEMQTLSKLRGTYAYTAPEIYHKAQYSAKSDVYSMGVIYWELATRLVKGAYERPFAEFAHIKYDYQIIHQTATAQLRPTCAPLMPPKFRQIIAACWTQEPERRPSAAQLLEGLAIATKDFDRAPRRWYAHAAAADYDASEDDQEDAKEKSASDESDGASKDDAKKDTQSSSSSSATSS